MTTPNRSPFQPRAVRGSVALVTGAGSGIGRAIAVALAREGCHLALLARTAADLRETAMLCAAHGVRTLTLPADLTDAVALAAAVERCVAGLGGLDLLINNAGIFDWAAADSADPDTWDRLVDVNLRAAMRATRLALPHVIEGGRGAIVFIASMAGRQAFGMNAAYVASKHGLVGFAGSVFQDVRNRNVKVCAVCPGLVKAGAALTMNASDEAYDRFIRPEDVAEAVRFVVTFSGTACPTEIVLQPQLDPFA